jgi:TonB-linked SusC/RagA family outer membrane protein
VTFRHPNVVSGASPGGSAGRSTDSSLDRIVEFTGTFSDRFADHSVTLLGGYSYSDFLEEDFSASNNRFPTDLFGWDALERGAGLGQGLASVGSGKESSKLIGFFSRLNYDYNNKYLLMASVRYEGNSVFGADHKWGFFPGVNAGWRISEESFMDGVTFFDDLRLRAGWGITGIAPNEPYQSLTSYSYGSRMFFNGQWVQGLSPSRNANPNLRWEEKEEINVGLNFSALDFRLNAALDVYRRDTKDMLFSYNVPVPPNLTSNFLANVGTMRNSGIEAEIGYDVIRRDNFTWNTSANWSYNKNKLVSLSDDVYKPQSNCSTRGGTGEPIQQSTHQLCVGQPIGNFFGYKSVDIDDNGIWIVERPAKFDSLGVMISPAENISINQSTAADRQVLGNGLPKQYFAWNNTAQIHDFDVSVNLRGAADFQVLNYYRMYYENPKIRQYNMLKSAFDPVYGKTREDGTPILLNHDLSYVSYYIEDGDYLKLDNVTIGYTFGEGALGRVSNVLSGARLYVSGRNLLTITGYKGMDPEVRINTLEPGQEQRDTYPTVRRFTAGVTFNF